MSKRPTKKTPQFFRGETAEPASAPRTDRAIYRVARQDKSGTPITVAVEVVEGGGNVPRNATSFRKVAGEIDLENELESVVAMAESVLQGLKAIRPGEVEIEFGVELGGEMGIPLVTKGQAKANFKITLKWKGKDQAE